MSAVWLKRAGWTLGALVIVAGVVWLAWPAPVGVDLATVTRGPMEVTADDDGKTHVRHIYTVSAPVAGKVLRISHPMGEQGPSIHVGDKAKFDVATNEAALASAKAQVDVRRSLRTSLAARLIDPTNVAPSTDSACCVRVITPASGRVLKIIQDSEAVVLPGAPLVDIGDPFDLEVVADLLSTDAVQIRVGAPVRIDGWGGPAIKGKVVRVDPAGFFKVSALGIEEQRVCVTIDFADPPETWSQLGHDYRVIVHVVIWSADDALTVPVSALFRKGDEWAVYAVDNGRAQTKVVKIGHRNNRLAEVVAGLPAGTQVVLHPSDRISDGTRVAERQIR